MNKKKKILFLINRFKVGGAERMFLHTINILQQRGYDAHLGVLYSSVAKNNFFSELKISDNKIKIFDFKNIYDWSKIKQLKKYIKDNNIEVIFSTLEDANIVARVQNILNRDLQVIIRESGMADRKSLKNKLFDNILNYGADSIVAVSSQVARSLEKYQSRHKKKIKIILNSIPSKDLLEVMKKRSQAKQSTFTILNIGAMKNENKGQMGLIHAIEDLTRNENLDLRLVLVSDGPLRKKYERYVKNNNLRDRVVFTGKISTAEVEKKYFSSDLYVLNSKSEGCSNTILEAMSHGVPTISTRVGGSSEIIQDGQNGFLFKYGDEQSLKALIKKLYDSTDLQDRVSRAAVERINNFYSLDVYADKILELIEN